MGNTIFNIMSIKFPPLIKSSSNKSCNQILQNNSLNNELKLLPIDELISQTTLLHSKLLEKEDENS